MNRVVIGLVAVLAWACGRAAGAEPPPPPPANGDATGALPPLGAVSVERQAFYRRTMGASYDQVGKHDPRWDDAARKLVATAAEEFGSPRTRHAGSEAQWRAAKALVKGGCDDPMVLYVHARLAALHDEDIGFAKDYSDRAADAMSASAYPAYFKALASARAVQARVVLATALINTAREDVSETERGAIVKRAEETAGFFKAVAAEGGVPARMWVDLGDAATGALTRMPRGTALAIESTYAAFERVAPKGAALTVKGELYTTWAWDARGRGAGRTVTPDGHRLMQERLAVAQAALEEAWGLDNGNGAAAARMIVVELGQARGRDRMELWFKRASAADPDDEYACMNKLNYLQPKWFGSAADLLKFGRECFATGRFRSDVPDLLRQAHDKLSRQFQDNGLGLSSDPKYYVNPDVWADLRAVSEGYLRAGPDGDVVLARNQYAADACRCHAWADAVKMFALIGDDWDSGIWPKLKQFEASRAYAQANATK